MSRLIIAIGLMGIASFISFIAGFMFASWGYREKLRLIGKTLDGNQWN